MADSTVDNLLELHTAFWNRGLEKPVVNVDCSLMTRSRFVPALPPEWESQRTVTLEPSVLLPERLQPAPFDLGTKDNTRGAVAFNTWMPYFRVPWLTGIAGCEVVASSSGQTVWPYSYLDDDWYELPRQGFAPRLDWLDKLLEFTQFIVDRYYPERCIPTTDLIARGPGDLLLHSLGPERLYLGLYDHPHEMKLLLDQITDIYIRWGQAQLEIIPKFHGGYCNTYGIWGPGATIRSQEDYATNLSRAHFEEFLLPGARRVAAAFEYETFHTHSGFPQLAEWMLEVDELKCIEVALDPTGPTLEESIPLWNRILDEKCLILLGPLTPGQLHFLVTELSPGGLWLDVEMVSDDQDMDSIWAWSHAKQEEQG
jgi:hypothetical protein